MLGVYDFNAHYDWTFAWITSRGGNEALQAYWVEAISLDSQRHARELFRSGFAGMDAYWGHTLAEEGAGYTSEIADSAITGQPLMRIDMYACPSKGFLLRNDVSFADDYCAHCIGWIGPALAEAGFVADHEHDHQAHCWWEIRAANDDTGPSTPGEISEADVRLLPDWDSGHVDRYCRSEITE